MKSIHFSDLILDRIALIDVVFQELSVPNFFNNNDVLVDKEETTSRSITFSINQPEKFCIPLKIILGENDIRVDIHNIVETFEWSKKFVENSREEIVTFFLQLFSSYILFEIYGEANKNSYMYLFDRTGIMIKEYPLRGLTHIFERWSAKNLFFPIYPLDNK